MRRAHFGDSDTDTLRSESDSLQVFSIQYIWFCFNNSTLALGIKIGSYKVMPTISGTPLTTNEVSQDTMRLVVTPSFGHNIFLGLCYIHTMLLKKSYIFFLQILECFHILIVT